MPWGPTLLTLTSASLGKQLLACWVRESCLGTWGLSRCVSASVTSYQDQSKDCAQHVHCLSALSRHTCCCAATVILVAAIAAVTVSITVPVTDTITVTLTLTVTVTAAASECLEVLRVQGAVLACSAASSSAGHSHGYPSGVPLLQVAHAQPAALPPP